MPMMATRRREELTMALYWRRLKGPKLPVVEPLTDLTTYLGFDNSVKLREYRLERLRQRHIASKRAANRDKDIAVLPILERTLRLSNRLRRRSGRRRR